MKSISLQESKQIQVQILSYIDAFCQQNNIKYSLYAGTLLGAVRHNGFIPWDDDIDIFMPRDHYERFVTLFDNSKSDYKLLSLESSPNYYCAFAKVEDSRTVICEHTTAPNTGIFVDIFPFDYVGDNMEESTEFVSKIMFWRKLYLAKLVVPTKRNKLYKRIIIYTLKILLTPFSLRTIAQIISKKGKSISLKTKYAADVAGGYGLKEILPSTIFDNLISLPFEGKLFKCIADYDIYLSSVFGNYMQLPPLEKRVSPHTISEMYWK